MPRSARGSPPASPSSCASAATASPPGFVGTPLVTDALTDGRAPLRRRAPAAADRVPVVALPRDDGRDHGVGALGQPAARRLGQPRRDDLVQPLRARRGRRLAAPHGRGPRARCPRLPPHPHRAAAARRRSTTRRARHLTPYGPASVAWHREATGCRGHGRGAAEHRRRSSTCRAPTPAVVGSGRHEWRFTERSRMPRAAARSTSTRRAPPSSTTPRRTARCSTRSPRRPRRAEAVRADTVWAEGRPLARRAHVHPAGRARRRRARPRAATS